MPHFSQASLDKLLTCHKDLQVIFNEVIEIIDCTVLEGFRNQENQDKAFAEGKSKLKWPNGKHNQFPSMAIDVAPYPVNFSNTKNFIFFGAFVVGTSFSLLREGKISHTVRWGGDWNKNYDLNDEKGLIDMPHFELFF